MVKELFRYFSMLAVLLASVSCDDGASNSEADQPPPANGIEARKRFIGKAAESNQAESLGSTGSVHVGIEGLKPSSVSEWNASQCLAGLTKIIEDKEGSEASADLRIVFQHLGSIDPEVGLSALEQLSVGQMRKTAIGALFNGISRANESQLFEILQRLPTEDDKKRALTIIASRLSGKPVESLLRIRATVTEGQSNYSSIVNKAIGASLSEQNVSFDRISELDLTPSDK